MADTIADWKAIILDSLLEDYDDLKSLGWSEQDAVAEAVRRSCAGASTLKDFYREVARREDR